MKNSSMDFEVVDAQISPVGRMEVLSRAEAAALSDHGQGGLREMFRNCSLAVLNCGNELDDGRELLQRYRSFEIEIVQRSRGVKLDIRGAPASAFVDGVMIRGIQEHLFTVLRDVIYASQEIGGSAGGRFDLRSSEGITDAVFHILRNAGIVQPIDNPNMVVCWGGHSISREEYDYTKRVGYQLGCAAWTCAPAAVRGR